MRRSSSRPQRAKPLSMARPFVFTASIAIAGLYLFQCFPCMTAQMFAASVPSRKGVLNLAKLASAVGSIWAMQAVRRGQEGEGSEVLACCMWPYVAHLNLRLYM